VLLEHSIQPVQQFAYTSGKNATDSSLIIDAMDLMYTRRFDGFCLVTSDSDFTRLAQRLRRRRTDGCNGFGEKKTPDAFRQACDKFVFTEVLPTRRRPPAAPAKKAGAQVRARQGSAGLRRRPSPAVGPRPPAKAGAPAGRAACARRIDQGSAMASGPGLGAVGSTFPSAPGLRPAPVRLQEVERSLPRASAPVRGGGARPGPRPRRCT
jgi:hypothetical protein